MTIYEYMRILFYELSQLVHKSIHYQQIINCGRTFFNLKKIHPDINDRINPIKNCKIFVNKRKRRSRIKLDKLIISYKLCIVDTFRDLLTIFPDSFSH